MWRCSATKHRREFFIDKRLPCAYCINNERGCMYKVLGADQKEYGPVTVEQVRLWIAQQRLNGQSLARLEGTEGWKPLAQFPEFATALTAPLPGPGPISPPIGYITPPGTNNMAVTGLVIGCVSLFCCQPLGILGIIFSAMALSQIKNTPDQPGKGMAITGLCLSILSLVILGLLVVFGAFSSLIQQISR